MTGGQWAGPSAEFRLEIVEEAGAISWSICRIPWIEAGTTRPNLRRRSRLIYPTTENIKLLFVLSAL